MISHRNVIANTLQITALEKTWRDSLSPAGGPRHTEVMLGLLPQSHIYALVVVCHAGPYRGDQVIVLPKFELKSYLSAIQQFKITTLFLVSGINSQKEDTKADADWVSSLRYPQSLLLCCETRMCAPSLT
jgi:acyl-CoA synthetase (AMP-forming)/AMP-acid ligase II